VVRNRDRFAVVVLLVVAGCVGTVPSPAGTPTSTPASGTTGTVTDVVDGDTVDVRLSGGTTERVRLIGVDTPEIHVETQPEEFEGIPDTETGRSCLRRHGELASEFATDRLAGRQITLRFDPSAGRRGGYGRLLAYVRVDGESFNAALLTRGHARLYDGTFRARERYATLEREARDASRGLWSC
jgi:micrococcal nuclease